MSNEEAYQQGREDERKEWECAIAELLIKYAGDICLGLPEQIKEIQDKAYQQGRKDVIEELRRYFSLSCIYGVTLSWHGCNDERAFDRILKEIEEEKRREEEDGTDDQEDRI